MKARRVRRVQAARAKARRPRSEGESQRPRPSSHDDMRKKLVTLADGTPCPICGKVMDDSLPKGHDQKPELDEIFPHVAGGAATAENSRIICRRCNRRKSDHLPGDPRSGDWYYTTRIPPPSYPGCPPYDDW